MAITQKTQSGIAPQKIADSFIAGAPDARPLEEHKNYKQIKMAGRKSIITLSIDPAILFKLDLWAKSHGMSRAAAVSFAVSSLDTRKQEV